MTSMQSTRLHELIFSDIADGLERNPVQGPAANGLATVPMGRGFGLWQRMNPAAQLVWVDDAEGHPRALTPKQAQVLDLACQMVDGSEALTMRQMAERLRFAPSTVSRALVKLASFGILAYIVGRGRYAGLVIFRRAHGDGLDRFRKAAKERVRRWAQAAERRISRLIANVAPTARGRGEDSLTTYLRDHDSVTATLIRQPWTVEELRESGIV
jgi:DNA-binding transcriptional regulator YhcF (GntR family)